MSTERIDGRLDQIQPPLWDATNDRTDQTSVAEQYRLLQQAWQKNKFKPTTRMEYLMRRIRGIWRRMVFRTEVISDSWDNILQSEKSLYTVGLILLTLCMLLGFFMGIYFPD